MRVVRRVIVGALNQTQRAHMVLPGGASWDPPTQIQVAVSASLLHTTEGISSALIGSLSSKDHMPLTA